MHAELLADLLPPVAYDPRAPRLAAGLAADGDALDAALASAARVLAAITPDGDTAMLPDWERVLGLPDVCTAGLDSSVTSRIAAALDKIRRGGGLSRQYFLDLAAAAGYSITITEYLPYTVLGTVADPINDTDTQYYWQVSLPAAVPPRPITVLDDVETPLVIYQPGVVECLFNRLKPAHTAIIWEYT